MMHTSRSLSPHAHQATALRSPIVAVLGCGLGALAASSCASTSTAAPAPAAEGALTPTSATVAASGPTNPPPLPPAEGNPFAGAAFFVSPDYRAKVDAAAAKAAPADAALMRKVADLPTAVWLSSIADVAGLPRILREADAQQKQRGGGPMVSVFALYNLPGRDCNAKASAGELAPDEDGERRYRKEFIDPIAAALRAHPRQRFAIVLETDSLGNLATNLGNPTCAAADGPYRRSTAYAVSKLAMPNVSVYLDAAHAGWLGWGGNRAKAAQIYKDILSQAGGADKIRGFFVNVSNYNVLHGDDGKRMEGTNPCPNELAYVNELADTLRWAGVTGKAFLVDTGRNGQPGLRKKWGSWCNVHRAGLGERPRAAPEPYVDAYFWVKPPGESDGTSDPKAARYDATCANPDAAPNAPEAGQWFQPYFVDLVRNANPPL